MKIRNFKDWKMFWKVLTAAIIPILIFTFIFLVYIIPDSEESLYRYKKEALKDNTEVAFSVIQEFYTKYNGGELSEAEAKEKALDVIEGLRYAGDNYFWINDSRPYMVMHPFNPDLNNKSLKESKDPLGKFLFVEMAQVAKSSGEGYVDYMWPKPGFSEPVPKISFVIHFKDWDWIIGTGVYVDDVEAEIASMTNGILFFLFLAIVITIIIGYFIGKLISKPLQDLTLSAGKVSDGDVELVVDVSMADEIGDLSRAFKNLVDNQKKKVRAVQDMAAGKLAKVELASDRDVLGIAYNKQVDIVSDLISETKELIDASSEGNLSERGNSEKYTGAWKEMIVGINSLLDAIVTPIRESMDALADMSNGDLTVRVKGDYKGDYDKLKNSMNTLGNSLTSLIGKITESIVSTANASTEISSSTEEIAAGSQEQSAQTTEVASAVEEMTKTILETANNASIASEASKKSSDQAKVGVEKVTESKEGMNRIISSAQNTGEIISSLANKTDQIGKIAQVIDDIADQTNLLALNAAIEAARAGEQGRGFAVVADEVRKLAERTTKATKEIAETIRAIQIEAKDADDSMKEAGVAVNNGKMLTEEVEEALRSILDSTESVRFQIDQVAAASEEQSSAAEQISKNIDAINSVTNESAAGIQEIARSTEDLNRLMENLKDMVSAFKLADDQDAYYNQIEARTGGYLGEERLLGPSHAA